MLWLILGLVIGAGAVGLAWFVQTRRISIRWYEWVLGAAAVVLALMALQNYLGSFADMEPAGGTVLLAMFGVPALVLAGIAALLVWRRQRTPAQAKA